MDFTFQSTGPAPGAPEARGQEERASTPKTVAQNLLVHIPGESSGFYLLALGLLNNPDLDGAEKMRSNPEVWYWMIFGMAIVTLFLIRIAAKASKGVILSSLGAFLIWMAILDGGVFREVFLENEDGKFIIPQAVPLIVAAFYSAVVVALGSMGKIR